MSFPPFTLPCLTTHRPRRTVDACQTAPHAPIGSDGAPLAPIGSDAAPLAPIGNDGALRCAVLPMCTGLDPCNIVLYLHSKNPYLHLISRTSCNKYIKHLIYIKHIISLTNSIFVIQFSFCLKFTTTVET